MLISSLSGKSPPPIFTLDLIFIKTYIVTSQKLFQAVQRNSRVISFEANLTAVAERMAGIFGDGVQKLKEKESGGEGLNGTLITRK